MENKIRVGYVDLVKGLCIFFVMSFHCHVTYTPWFYDFIRSVYLPVFFFCSALFINPRQPFRIFLLRKVNLLLVPWAFFLLVCMVGYASVYVWHSFMPGSGLDWQSPLGHYSLYKFLVQPANLPTWFLWCIFVAFMVYYAVARNFSNRWIKCMIVLVLAAAGLWLEQAHVRRPLQAYEIMRYIYGFHVFSALEMLPFMFAGEELRKRGLLDMKFNNLRGIIFMTVCLAVWYVSSQRVYVSLFGHAWPAEAYITSFAAIGFMFAAASVVRYLPLFNFLGRFSLTTLCTHYMIYEAASYFISNLWLLLVVVTLITVAAVKLLVKYLPAFTGQRNLIPLSGEKRGSLSV